MTDLTEPEPGISAAPDDRRVPRIAVFGSANMDLVAYVPTAPRLGETVTGDAFHTVPGGKGANQAVAAARAGGVVSMIGAVGADAFGPQLRGSLVESGVDTSGLRTCDEASGIAHIVVDSAGGNSIIVVPGANGTVTELAAGDVHRLADADVLLLQLEIPLPGVLAAARAARAQGVRVVLTPAPAQPLPAEILEVTDLLVPNEHEATALTGRSDPAEAADELLGVVPEVVVTLGSAGSRYAARDAGPVHVPARKVAARDTTAAGDTFVGALAVASGEGRPMPTALAWASAASALSVQRAGASAAMPYRAEIDAFAATPTETD